jgi:hypothetical protein
MAYGPFQGAVENPAGARPRKCIIIIDILWYCLVNVELLIFNEWILPVLYSGAKPF